MNISGDIMTHVGDIMSTLEGVQCVVDIMITLRLLSTLEGYHEYKGKNNEYIGAFSINQMAFISELPHMNHDTAESRI